MGSTTTVLRYLITFVLCVSLSTGRFLEPSRRFHTNKRQGTGRLFFKREGKLEKYTDAVLHSNVELHCQAGGSPPPTIHWLKDGVRIEQGGLVDNKNDEAYFEDRTDDNGNPLIRLSFTKSILYLDCITSAMQANYTCVAETPTKRVTSTTELKIVASDPLDDVDSCLMKRSIDVPARQFLWTSHRIEKAGASVQLFCRSEGTPTPTTMWMDNKNRVISEDDPNYEYIPNGDLLIHNLKWTQMGKFSCISSNSAGEDLHQTFVYPTK